MPQLEKPASQNKVCSCSEDQVQSKKRRGSQMLAVTGHGFLFPSAEKQVSQAPEKHEEVHVLCLPLLQGEKSGAEEQPRPCWHPSGLRVMVGQGWVLLWNQVSWVLGKEATNICFFECSLIFSSRFAVIFYCLCIHWIALDMHRGSFLAHPNIYRALRTLVWSIHVIL